MNKFLHLAASALIAAAATPLPASAELLLEENFNYPAGNLWEQGGWVHHSKNTNEPIQLVTPALSYEGYMTAPIGMAAKLIGSEENTPHERLQKQFSEQGITSGTLYASALINVQKSPTGDVYSLTLCQKGAKADTGIMEGKTGSEYPRVHCLPGSTDTKFILGVSKNGSSAQSKTDELDLNTTYLIVLKYTFVDGTNNDTVELFVNPSSGEEPSATIAADASKADVSASYGLQGITLRQGSTALKIGADILVDDIRIADNWADLWTNGESPVEKPSIEVSQELFVDAEQWQPINRAVTFAKFTVVAKNLPRAANVYLGGQNRNQFSITTQEIPAGDSETEIKVIYLPTATGIQRGSLTIDAMPTELSQSFQFTARAYDPDNLPEITVNTDNLVPFTSTVGTQAFQTITYSTKGLLDYGAVKLIGGEGQFRISTSSMLKDTENSQLVITFAPLKAGTFNATIEFSADMADTRTVHITGTATGENPVEDKEGDEFTMASFDTSSPRFLVIEDFQNCGDSNKPLHINGWTNAAITGTRAWWAYTDINDATQKMAKITAYDSKADESTLCQMLLLSPCLDYANAKQQLLTFRIMGKNMLDTQVDNLQVLYIDPATEQATALDLTPASSPLDEVYAEAIGGLDIPASADYNGEWRDYVLDLKGLELADKFFIGFGFTSMRGHDSSTMYFVDDFSWGRDDIPFIRIDQPVLDMEVVVNQQSTSAPVSVEGLNLTGPVTLSVTGANASKFSVSSATLPANGGTFTVSFTSDTEGVHACYIKLSSDGAPDTYLSVEANNKIYDSIYGMDTDSGNKTVDVYNLQGILIKSNITAKEAMRQLPAGMYIIGNRKVHIK